jgi:UDP-N-acetyl-D-mannosaminuronic acid dehydrogenase
MHTCFIGLGYIGLPTAVLAASAGITVSGVDTNPLIVETVNRGEIHFSEPGVRELCWRVLAAGMFRACARPQESDVFVIAVPTPFKENHAPDISYVQAAVRSAIPFLRPGNLLIIESTCPVGTTEKIADMVFSERPDLQGKLFVSYCPERVLPGNTLYELENNDRVIGGLDEESTGEACGFYRRFVKGALHKTNARTAEMCKLTENSSRDVQIAFANELSLICDKAGINVWELIDLANKHPRVHILQPGSGVGGHCIAVDPYFITADFPIESQLIGKARELNNYKAFWCAEKILEAIRRFAADNGREPSVALLGLAFKPNIDDLRESPAGYIAAKVMQEHASARFLVAEPNIAHHKTFTLTSCEEAYAKADIAAFLVAHDQFRKLPWSDSKVILDFCGIFKK